MVESVRRRFQRLQVIVPVIGIFAIFAVGIYTNGKYMVHTLAVTQIVWIFLATEINQEYQKENSDYQRLLRNIENDNIKDEHIDELMDAVEDGDFGRKLTEARHYKEDGGDFEQKKGFVTVRNIGTPEE